MDVFTLMDQWCAAKIPYLFIIDFEANKPLIFRLDELNHRDDIWVDFPNYKSEIIPPENKTIAEILPQTIPYATYSKAFDNVMTEIKLGNSYLANLTFETEIKTKHSLQELYAAAKAKYKLSYNHEFICFSPESFIKITEGKISTFPMKGTIDASLENAEQQLLNNKKEKAEHYTVVDLLRNDLSKVARNVTVTKFRYIDTITTRQKTLLQSSSEIEGTLKPEYKNALGSVLQKLLPAGSVTGAPKRETVKIINKSETHSRNYYTGVMGVFDGENVDSAVMIRYIENKNGKLYYKSGGGITHLSNKEEEFDELKHKIYVPIS